MKDYKISVIVPVYNLENCIERTVQSILNQTYINIEVILVDDGSTDNSPIIIDELQKMDTRIRVIHKENAGVAMARLSGIQIATGDWLGFVDGDDLIDRDMFERLMNNALEYKVDISHCGYKMVFPSHIDYYYNTGKLVRLNSKEGVNALLEGEYIEPGLWNKIYKKEVVDEVIDSGKIDFSIKINEDLLMNFYLFQQANSSVYEDFCPYHYVIRAGSASTSSINENKLKDPLKVINIMMGEFQEGDNSYKILMRRKVAQLIRLIILRSNDGNESLLKTYRVSARKELKQLLPHFLRGSYPIKQKFQSLLVVTSPYLYSSIYSVYAYISGINRKYDVK